MGQDDNVVEHPAVAGSKWRTWEYGEVRLVATRGGLLDQLCEELGREFPGLAMQFKARHWYWRLLHWVVLLVTFGRNREFNSRFTTTVRRIVGWSEGYEERITKRTADWEVRVWSCLRHEREHLRQFERYGTFLMMLSYVFLPFPVGLSYCRARFERAGYLQTLACWYQLDPSWARSSTARDWWVSQFTSGAYGWMWPFPKTVRRWYDEKMKTLEAA